VKTYNELYLRVRNALMNAEVEGYALEARLIVATAAGKNPEQLLRDMNLYTSPAVAEKTEEMLANRLKGEPVAYLTGSWEFYGLPMIVSPDVLIPRMDTEVLVDAAKEIISTGERTIRVLDLCTGSGCIACAVGSLFPTVKLVAVDISAKALEICRKNVAANRLNNRVVCMQADALAAPPMGVGQFDMIISNPPYIATDEIMTLDSSVRDYEPIWALDGGKSGYQFYKAIIKYWKSALKPGGHLLFEVGEGQAEYVAEMLLSGGFRAAETRKDTLGVDRVVIGHY